MEITLQLVLAGVASLVGFPALWALVIDVLKYFGVVNDGTSGKWSLGFNLLSFTAVAIVLQFFPNFNLVGLDAQVIEIVKLAGYVVGILLELFGTKLIHVKLTKPLVLAKLMK